MGDRDAAVTLQVQDFRVEARDAVTDTTIRVFGSWNGHRIPGHQWEFLAHLDEETTVRRVETYEVTDQAIEAATRMATQLLRAKVRAAEAEGDLEAIVAELRSS